MLRQVQFSTLKHEIISEGTSQHYLQEQAKFAMRGGPIRECAVLTRMARDLRSSPSLRHGIVSSMPLLRDLIL